MTRKASLVGEAKSICSIMFLIFPNYLLNCSLQQSSKLLCTDNSAAIDRAELLLEYKSFCSLSTVSKIAIEVLSFGCNTYLNYTIGYIKQLADIIHNSIHSDGNAVVAGSISVGATTKLIDALTLASQLSYSTNEHATDSSTKESSDKTNTDTNLQSVCKDILVHTVFLLRDLLLADVNLLPKYFPLLLESITFKKATAGILSSDFGKLSGTSSLYPNSIECLYVLLVGNVVESLYPSNMSDVYNNSLSNNSKTSKRFSSNYLIARKSVRSLFIKESTIQYFVDICQRMIEHRQQIHKIVSIEDNVAGGSSLDNFYNSIDADAVNFLLDAAMIFFVDIPEGSMSNNATDNSSKVINSFTKGIFESLSTTRMLPMILDLFVKLLSHYCNNITINDKTIVLPRVPAIMKALCDR